MVIIPNHHPKTAGTEYHVLVSYLCQSGRALPPACLLFSAAAGVCTWWNDKSTQGKGKQQGKEYRNSDLLPHHMDQERPDILDMQQQQQARCSSWRHNASKRREPLLTPATAKIKLLLCQSGGKGHTHQPGFQNLATGRDETQRLRLLAKFSAEREVTGVGVGFFSPQLL